MSAMTAPRRHYPILAITEPAQREAAMRIRFAVFVDEQGVPPELEPDEYDEAAEHLLVLNPDNGEAAGTARIVDKGEGIGKIGRVAVLPEHRCHGVGSALMRFALGEMRRAGFRLAILDAQLPVLGFYEKLGFVAEGPVFDDAGIDHRRMTLPLARRE